MNNAELKIVILVSALLGTFFFAVLYNTFERKIEMPVCIPYSAVFEKPGIRKLDNKTYQIYIVARMWEFDTGEIVINQGSTVDFYLTSKDVVHGFNIERKAVNLMAIPGAVNKTTISFNDPGTYRIVCHEYCGIGHQGMMGKVIVTNN
jgi:cytochrome c oxidase subunit 2